MLTPGLLTFSHYLRFLRYVKYFNSIFSFLKNVSWHLAQTPTYLCWRPDDTSCWNLPTYRAVSWLMNGPLVTMFYILRLIPQSWSAWKQLQSLISHTIVSASSADFKLANSSLPTSKRCLALCAGSAGALQELHAVLASQRGTVETPVWLWRNEMVTIVTAPQSLLNMGATS